MVRFGAKKVETSPPFLFKATTTTDFRTLFAMLRYIGVSMENLPYTQR
jgi:hypothetical protein